MRHILSHVDLRVRDRAGGIAFYEAILGTLGHVRSESELWVTFAPPDEEGAPDDQMWFGFTVDPQMTPGLTRVAFRAQTCEDVDRVTTVALEIGAQNIEGPDYSYGPEYYAVFFEDPDGNRLEVCCCGPEALAAS
jgi:catechol 2,3-dioxygenase-like lactoylglutathione lyase family enzyme